MILRFLVLLLLLFCPYTSRNLFTQPRRYPTPLPLLPRFFQLCIYTYLTLPTSLCLVRSFEAGRSRSDPACRTARLSQAGWRSFEDALGRSPFFFVLKGREGGKMRACWLGWGFLFIYLFGVGG